MTRRSSKAAGPAVSYFRLAGDQFAVVSVALTPVLPDSLTRAEREVMGLVLAGKSNAAIARARQVSIRTVANQIAASLRKLNVGSRAELIAMLARGAA